MLRFSISKSDERHRFGMILQNYEKANSKIPSKFFGFDSLNFLASFSQNLTNANMQSIIFNLF